MSRRTDLPEAEHVLERTRCMFFVFDALKLELLFGIVSSVSSVSRGAVGPLPS
jgi:hypothetical protein